MDFDSLLLYGLPLGVVVSGVLTLLRSRLKLSKRQARAVVAFAGLVVFAAGALESMTWAGALSALATAIELVCGSEGFYQWIGKHLPAKPLRKPA